MDNLEIMNEKQVARYLGRSDATIRKLRKAGLIPALTIPGLRSPFYSKTTIDRWVSGDVKTDASK